MFDKMNELQKYYIYHGLKLLVEKGDGKGFHNSDYGHPAYTIPASGRETDHTNLGDGPEQNQIFQMLKFLSDDMRDTYLADDVKWFDFTDWKTFCEFVVNCHNQD